MSKLYFELKHEIVVNNRVVPAGYYTTNAGASSYRAMPRHLLAMSDRVWKSRDSEVYFIKNRRGSKVPVDPKEFLWIVFQARYIED